MAVAIHTTTDLARRRGDSLQRPPCVCGFNEVDMKICTKCKVPKELDEFHNDKGKKDGKQTYCKKCRIAYLQTEHGGTVARATRKAYYKSEHGHAMLKARRETEKWKERKVKSSKEQRLLYPEKYKARQRAGNAVQGGRLVKQPCEVCGTTDNVEMHHDDYSKPLDVRWLCKKHHVEHHQRQNLLTSFPQSHN